MSKYKWLLLILFTGVLYSQDYDKRIQRLAGEHQKGREQIVELQQQINQHQQTIAQLQATLLRIEGAIAVLNTLKADTLSAEATLQEEADPTGKEKPK